MKNRKSNLRILFLVILVGLISTILSPLGDILAEGLVDELKVIFGENYKIPTVIISILLTGGLYLISEGGFKFEGTKSQKDLINNSRNIFVFGNVYVGKTVIINSLINYMGITVGNLSPTVEDRIKYQRKILEIKSGVLPPATRVNIVEKLNVIFEPDEKDKRKLNITFLDLSGEHFYHVEHSEEEKKKYEEYFKNKYTKFLIVTSFDRASEDDQLISYFIENLENLNRDLENDILLIISKWDRFYEGDDVMNFMKFKMPSTYRSCRKNKISATSFSVGIISNKENESEKVYYDKNFTKPIYDWIYSKLIKK